MRRKWFMASWLAIALGAIVVAGIAFRGSAGHASAATQHFGPKEADVTTEGVVWKTVHLTASKFQWKFRDDQQAVEVWGYNNQIPGPTLRFKAGDKVRIYFRNDLDEASTINWQNLMVSNSFNGVAGLPQPPVMPGDTLVYEFTIPNTPGTFVYHANMDAQRQVGNGLSGAFIVDPRDNGGAQYDQDRIMLLSNVAGHYLINGKEFPNTDPWLVKSGDRLHVRMINISPTEGVPMHFQGHSVKEIARDGIDETGGARPPAENTVWIAPGQTIDLDITMKALGKGAWLFQSQTLSQVAGPDGTSLNVALATGGMTVPVVYTDSLNFDAIDGAFRGAFSPVIPNWPGLVAAQATSTPQSTPTPQGTPTPQASSAPQSG